MYIHKTKSYSNLIPLAEIKTHLRIDESNNEYDQELRTLSTVALSDAERFIDFDIVPTVSIIEDYEMNNCTKYQIHQPNIEVLGITGQTMTTGFTTVFTYTGECMIYRYNQYCVVELPTGFKGDKMIIKYRSGSSTLKPNIKHATLLRIGYYFDLDRQGGSIQAINNSKAWERLLTSDLNFL